MKLQFNYLQYFNLPPAKKTIIDRRIQNEYQY